MTQYECAILDDYQNVVLQLADWSSCSPAVTFTVFNRPLGNGDDVAKALKAFQIVCMMRERTAFRGDVIRQLPNLRLLVTTGMRNAAIDLNAAKEMNVLVCGTQSASHPTAELTIAHLLEFTRKVGFENARMKGGVAWQSTFGRDLNGKTLGVSGSAGSGHKWRILRKPLA
jgi:lactate dehydrogenase-like 2-hydroxyacid dehydrogenase